MTSISSVNCLVLLADTGQGRWSHSWETIEALPGDWARWVRCLLFQFLIHQPPAWGLHDPLLVRLGRIAMPCAIRKPLHHYNQPKVYDLNIDAELKPVKVTYANHDQGHRYSVARRRSITEDEKEWVGSDINFFESKA